jgi:hypothetical protein
MKENPKVFNKSDHNTDTAAVRREWYRNFRLTGLPGIAIADSLGPLEAGD